MYLARAKPEHKINNGEIALEKSQLATGEPPIHSRVLPVLYRH